MIIWINGAFGSGKTQTAYELHRRMKHSYVYDPENVGCFIRKNVPQSAFKPDFQDYTMWRKFNFDMLCYISECCRGNIIVPMTIVNKRYYDEIIGALSKKYDVKHFILYAEKNTLLKRLASRFEGRKSWAARQIDRCVKAFDEDIEGYKIITDNMGINEVAEAIAKTAGITLTEDKRSFLHKFWDRLIIKYKHIR